VRDRVVATCKTLRLRAARRPHLAASLVAAAAVAVSVLYLDFVGWDSVGSAVGIAYHQAVAATSRTVARFRRPMPVNVEPERPRGAEIIPLPVMPSSPTGASVSRPEVEIARQVGLGSLP
jgi:hypothetical protein